MSRRLARRHAKRGIVDVSYSAIHERPGRQDRTDSEGTRGRAAGASKWPREFLWLLQDRSPSKHRRTLSTCCTDRPVQPPFETNTASSSTSVTFILQANMPSHPSAASNPSAN